jgi:hypothetical protein
MIALFDGYLAISHYNILHIVQGFVMIENYVYLVAGSYST